MELSAPIFLVGFPRSGTTFLQSLIATQEGIFSYPETHFYTVLTGYLDDSSVLGISDIEEMVSRAEQKLGMNLDLNTLVHDELSSGHHFPRKEVFINMLESLSQSYGLESPRTNGRLLEKTPSHAWQLDKIISDFPDARIIHISRHPVDSINSHYFKLSKGLRPISALIDDWIKTYDLVKDFSTRFPSQFLHVSYEELLLQRAEVMQSVMQFIDLPLDYKLLENHSRIADRFILEREVWKEGNLKDDHPVSSKKTLPLKDILTIQLRCATRMKSQGYMPKHAFLQRLYEWKNG